MFINIFSKRDFQSVISETISKKAKNKLVKLEHNLWSK